jgi:hypothetical protein
MPSRKKAKGRARKAEKEKQAHEQARVQQHASCKHSTILENASGDDKAAVFSLFREHVDKSNNLLQLADCSDQDFMDLFDETYSKYSQFNDTRKQVFREIVVAYGTENCVMEANKKDLTKETTMGSVLTLDSSGG